MDFCTLQNPHRSKDPSQSTHHPHSFPLLILPHWTWLEQHNQNMTTLWAICLPHWENCKEYGFFMDMPPKHEGTQGTKNQASEKASGPLGFKPKTENRGLETIGKDRASVSFKASLQKQGTGKHSLCHVRKQQDFTDIIQHSVQPPKASFTKENQDHRNMYLLHQNEPYQN